MNVDIVVIGAGVAGLAAAAATRAAGLTCVILEATDRIGGRARTVSVHGAPFDLGATWLHDAERNPLTAIAERHGDEMIGFDTVRERRKYIGKRLATAEELADFDQTWEDFTEVATARALSGADVSVAEAIAPLRDRPWTATVEYWEACLIAAADPQCLSVRDWHLNLLDGTNLEIAGGIGAFVERRLGPTAGTIWTDAPATRITWNGPGGRVSVDTPRGRVTAAACVVTVSTGVLASGAIAFEPGLPVRMQDAIAGLPMGLLSKIALPATTSDRLGLPDRCSLQRQVRNAREPMMSFHCWPSGRPHIVGFVGGPGAWALAREGDGAVEAFARTQLREMLGADADRTLAAATLSSWAHDPAFLGAYAYATPGNLGARESLAEPLADGHLVFAGEAICTDGLAGTVGGACLSGQRAARMVADALGTAVAD